MKHIFFLFTTRVVRTSKIDFEPKLKGMLIIHSASTCTLFLLNENRYLRKVIILATIPQRQNLLLETPKIESLYLFFPLYNFLLILFSTQGGTSYVFDIGGASSKIYHAKLLGEQNLLFCPFYHQITEFP